ncbi:MAG: L,D-transpeptidase, partial [Selenomonadaceae bacterium]|nr:L,D-transpeptidase [Selenomonadaceae bacterium]
MSEVHALKFFTALILSATFILGTLISPAQAAGKKIIVNVASRLMLFFDGDTKVAVYHLGLGKVSTPTPTGYYKITEKEINPTWIDPSDPEHEIPSGSDNPLGYRWMQFQGNYGIHGTNRPESIGGYVS